MCWIYFSKNQKKWLLEDGGDGYGSWRWEWEESGSWDLKRVWIFERGNENENEDVCGDRGHGAL